MLKLDLIYGASTTILQFNRSVSSVEHLMPRTIENSNWHVDPEFHSQYVHKLGNLVLVDRAKNSSMYNKRYSAKKEIYANYIETRANTNYVFMTYPDWTKESLLHNQSRVEHLFRYYYEGNSLESILEYKKNGIKEFNLSVASVSPNFKQGTLI